MEKRIGEIEDFIINPICTQEKILFKNLEKAKNTEFGLNFNFKGIHNSDQFKRMVPIHEYHDLSHDIERMKKGGVKPRKRIRKTPTARVKPSEFLFPKGMEGTRFYEPGLNPKEQATQAWLREKWKDKYGY